MVELRDYQVACLKALVDYRRLHDEGHPYGGQRALVAMATGLGKAQPVDEPVLTPWGWRALGSLVPGDYVIGANGGPTRVTGLFPQGKQSVVQVVFSDGSQTRCSWDHLWAVRDRFDVYHKTSWRVMTAAEIAHRIDQRWRIPIVAPVEFPDAPLPLDAYLLGVLLGDGGLSQAGVVMLHTEDALANTLQWPAPVRLAYVHADGPNQIASTYIVGGPPGAGRNPVLSALRFMGLEGATSHNKRIPPLYFVAAKRARLDLLQGLLDTDGYVGKDNHVEYVTVSEGLAQDVQALVWSLGGTARIVGKATSWTHKGEKRHGWAWRLSISMTENPFRWKAGRWHKPTKYGPYRFIETIVSMGVTEQACLKVAAQDQLYVTRDYVVTHNTQVFAQIPKLASKRVLVIAHREELLDQAALRIQEANPGMSVGIEQADRHAPEGCKVLVGSIQTFAMSPKRLAALRPDDFSVVVVDEVHHIVAASYLRLLAYFGLAPDQQVVIAAAEELEEEAKDLGVDRVRAKGRGLRAEYRNAFRSFKPAQGAPYLVGFTATPSRSDGTGLEWIMDDIVYSMSIREGMEKGWLCKIRGIRVESGDDISSVPTAHGDYQESALARAVDTPRRNALAVPGD